MSITCNIDHPIRIIFSDYFLSKLNMFSLVPFKYLLIQKPINLDYIKELLFTIF